MSGGYGEAASEASAEWSAIEASGWLVAFAEVARKRACVWLWLQKYSPRHYSFRSFFLLPIGCLKYPNIGITRVDSKPKTNKQT